MKSSLEKLATGFSPDSPESVVACFATFLSSLIFRLNLLIGPTLFEGAVGCFVVWGCAPRSFRSSSFVRDGRRLSGLFSDPVTCSGRFVLSGLESAGVFPVFFTVTDGLVVFSGAISCCGCFTAVSSGLFFYQGCHSQQRQFQQ